MIYFILTLILCLYCKGEISITSPCANKDPQPSNVHCIKTAIQYGVSRLSNTTHSNVIAMDTTEDTTSNNSIKYNQGIICTPYIKKINSHCWNLEPLFWNYNEKHFFLKNFSRQFMDTYLSDNYINMHVDLIICYSAEPISCQNSSNYTLYASIHIGAGYEHPVHCSDDAEYQYEKALLSTIDSNQTFICLLPRSFKSASQCLDRNLKIKESDFLNDFGGPIFIGSNFATGCCGMNISFPLTVKSLNVFNLIMESFSLILFLFHLVAPLIFKELRQYPRNLIWFLVLFSFFGIIFHIIVVNLMSSFSLCLLFYILFRFCVMAGVFCTSACLLDLLNSVRMNELIPVCKCKPIQYYTMSAKIYRKYCVWFSIGLSVLCVIVDILVSYALSNDSFYHLQLCSQACNMLLFVPDGTYSFYTIVELLIFLTFIVLMVILEHRLRKNNTCACISCNTRRSLRLFWKVFLIFLLPWIPRTFAVVHSSMADYLASFVLAIQATLIVLFFTCVSSVRKTIRCFILKEPTNAYMPSVIS